nr:MAG TPA: hypothetical protein [Caudoviricetes sp.]DAP73514.1 MAG TPA: hypothetical protein [Caudoviricetes sp.]
MQRHCRDLRRCATATQGAEWQRHGRAMLCEGYEVNCCAVAAHCDLPHRGGTEKHRQARQRQGEAERRFAKQRQSVAGLGWAKALS